MSVKVCSVSILYWPKTKSFLFSFNNTHTSKAVLSKTLFTFNKYWIGQNIATFLVPIIFFVIFYFHWCSKDPTKAIMLGRTMGPEVLARTSAKSRGIASGVAAVSNTVKRTESPRSFSTFLTSASASRQWRQSEK